jgi:uncharacterized protein (DUF433 family)
MLQVHDGRVPIEEDASGRLQISGSGVSLSSIIARHEIGDSAKEIAEAFPTLSLADVHHVLSYCLRHQQEIREHLAAEERSAEALRQKIEAEFPTGELREKVLRQQKKPSS